MTQAHVNALRIARRRIESGAEEFICCALPKTPCGDRLRNMVGDAISPQITLTDWACRNANYGVWPDSDQMRLYRLRWLDHLIEQAKDWE